MEEQKREFKGVWIPKEIWLDDRLTALEKVIFTEINSLDDEKTGCYASNEYLAKFCQCTQNTVSTAINKLKKLNYIEMVNFDGRHRTLKIVRQTPKNLEADSKKVGPNNIYSNSNNINIINNLSTNSVNSEKKKLNNNTSIIKKKTKKELLEEQKQQNDIAINNLIDKFTDNPDIQELLEQYVEIRKERGLTPAQFMIILDDLKTYCGNDVIHQEMCIRKAIAGGWSQIVFIDNFKGKAKTTYSSVDNTSTHFVGNNKITDESFYLLDFENQKQYLNNMSLADMTPKQKEFFEKYCLARDDDGNLLKF